MDRVRSTSAPFILLLALAVLISACSSAPPRDAGRDSLIVERGPETPGTDVARTAIQYIGTPYRYGGDSPRGFDCSGLVLYSHERVGLNVPRTAAAQSEAAKPVPIDELRPGDLVFFRVDGREVDHVGIYLGAGRFVHAPRTGRAVTSANLGDPYYVKRFYGAGRFW
jgi:cell wall-associated NlpC family hydrolase